MKAHLLTMSTFVALSAHAQVVLQPGDDIQSIVDQNDPGTAYQLSEGTYRLQRVRPKDGDSFEGVGEVILTGARLLTNWTQEGNYWVHTGQDQNGQRHGSCSGSYTMCSYPEDLFLDDELLWQVASLNELDQDSWYFDYDNDKVYMTQDPAGKKAEISTSRGAFHGDASGVTLKNLIVEKYAIPAQMGAIGDQNPGDGWIIDGCESRWNHGVGLKIAGAGIVRNCYIHHNGQMGVGASGDGGLFEDNEIAYNLTVGYSSGWEGGGSKFQGTDSLVVRNNYVHHNHGPGLWTDINNYNTLYEGNLVEYNEEMGIFHEISFAATIRCNTVRYNSEQDYPWLYGSQILVSTSRNVEVHDNVVTVSAEGGNGISIINQDRGTNWYSENNYVHHNTITFLGDEGQTGVASDYDNTNFWANGNNLFDYNTYHVANASVGRWRYQSGSYSWSSFLNQGQEAHGTVDEILSGADLTACPDQEANKPVASFSTPFDGAVFSQGQDIGVIVDVNAGDYEVEYVLLYLNEILVRQENNPPYEWGSATTQGLDEALEAMGAGTYVLKAIAMNDQGVTGETSITIEVSTPDEADCAGDVGGSATIDNCGECVGGSTGKEACEEDCNTEWGGSATVDDCQECTGGNTGVIPNSGCLVSSDGQGIKQGYIALPNPVTDRLTIDLTNSDQMAEVIVLNPIGQVAFKQTTNGSQLLHINLENLPSGIYSLVVKNSSGKLTQKLVKQ